MKPRLRRTVAAIGLLLCGSGSTGLAYDSESPASTWWSPGSSEVMAEVLNYNNAAGQSRVVLDGGAQDTAGHPFFSPLGVNGRGCISCHQPSDGMSLSVKSIVERWQQTGGADPIFAAVDGSNCPTLPQGDQRSHSLLLERGLFRVQLPWPPKPRHGQPVIPDYDIRVVRDPWGCNTGKRYGLEAKEPSVSVYRRPRPVANLKYLTAVGFPYDPKQGMPLPVDEITGAQMSGNIMADNRAETLGQQMQDAARAHLEMQGVLSDQQQQAIEQFITRVYAAQSVGANATALNVDGALGGPEVLRDSKAGRLGNFGRAVWSEYQAWEQMDADTRAALSPEQLAFRESVARGARVFREKMFLITDSAGINSPVGFGNPVLNSCVFCHNMSQMGNDVAPGQVDLGTNNLPFADPAPELPLFEITCNGEPHPHYGKTILTTDPGFGLITGRCADVGKITLQSMRSLSSRAPYFANGSAKDLRALVDYYDRRYNIGYSEQEKTDLVNLMSVL